MHYWVSSAINKRGFWDCICVGTHLLRFERSVQISSVYWRSFIDLCLLNLPKPSSFKSFGGCWCHKINLPSCVARRPLCHKIKLPRCEAWRHHFIMTCDIFCTGQTSILGLCYLFGKLINNPQELHSQVIEINTFDKITVPVETNHTISLAFKTLYNDTQSLRLKYNIPWSNS